MIERISGKQTLGFLTLFFLLAFPAVSHALCEANLEWGSVSSDSQGYYVFGREEGQDYDYDEPWWQGDETFTGCTIDELEEDKTYYFVVRAFAGDDMSVDSNEVSFSYADSESLSDEAPPDESSSLSNDETTSDANISAFHGSSGGCFISSIFGTE